MAVLISLDILRWDLASNEEPVPGVDLVVPCLRFLGRANPASHGPGGTAGLIGSSFELMSGAGWDGVWGSQDEGGEEGDEEGGLHDGEYWESLA